MPQTAINVEALQRAAVNYQNELARIPIMKLMDAASALKINVISLKENDKVGVLERRGNIMRPYILGTELVRIRELARVKEYPLNLAMAYSNLVEDITTYQFEKAKKVLSNAGEPVDLKANKHPLEAQVVFAMVSTFGEDTINAMFFAERNEADQSPLGSFDGFFAYLDALTAAGEVSVAKGNLVNSGEISAPVDANDTLAFTRVLAWLRAASPKLRSGRAIWRLSQTAINNITAAYANKVKNFKDPTWEETFAKLKDLCQWQRLEYATHYALGSGGRMTINGEYENARSGRDLFDFGINTDAAAQFCQVRAPFENPNLAQFFIQAAYGTRIKGVNPNVFLTNEQTNTAISLSGDYTTEEADVQPVIHAGLFATESALEADAKASAAGNGSVAVVVDKIYIKTSGEWVNQSPAPAVVHVGTFATEAALLADAAATAAANGSVAVAAGDLYIKVSGSWVNKTAAEDVETFGPFADEAALLADTEATAAPNGSLAVAGGELYVKTAGSWVKKTGTAE